MQSAPRKVLLLLLSTCILLGGCATIYHYERVGSPPQDRGDIDMGMLILDCAYVLVWGIGLIGLFVDFMTGAIYIPKAHQPWMQRQPQPENP